MRPSADSLAATTSVRFIGPYHTRFDIPARGIHSQAKQQSYNAFAETIRLSCQWAFDSACTRVESLLGAGGVGEVHLARDTRLERGQGSAFEVGSTGRARDASRRHSDAELGGSPRD